MWWKLPVFLRRWYLEELKDQKEREKKEVEESASGGGRSGSGDDEFSGEGVPDDYKSELSTTDRDKPELHEMMENAPPDVRRKWKEGE